MVNTYLAEAEEGEHGKDGRRQGKDQQVFADAVPLQAGVHQEGDQAERCRRLNVNIKNDQLSVLASIEVHVVMY